jgi:hypothetical protein
MLPKELDSKANKHTGDTQQYQWPKVNVKQEEICLPKELDTLIIECNVSSR